jgi:leader peptidase (prepilin peptidase)/N-methyltransferase
VALTGAEEDAAAADDRRFARARALSERWKIAVALVGCTLAAACFARYGFTGRAAVDAFFALVLVLLSAIDLDCRLIPNEIVLPALGICLVAQIALFPGRTLEWTLASLLAALGLFLPLLVVPTGMGMGDVKLAALLGAVLGKAVVAALFVGFLAGGLFAVVVLIREGRDARRKAIAYGPFLALGGIVVLLAGGR